VAVHGTETKTASFVDENEKKKTTDKFS